MNEGRNTQVEMIGKKFVSTSHRVYGERKRNWRKGKKEREGVRDFYNSL